MQLDNATRMVAGYSLGVDRSGRELLVVVIKGTFTLPKQGEAVHLAEEQLPLVMSDTFTGAPGLSAPRLEMDFAQRKHRCDVLLNGSARAPGGRRVTRMRVGLRVGSMVKAIDVVGDRVWHAGATGIRASDPVPFEQLPLSYDRAFGGVDRHSEDPAEHDAYAENPVGRGWHRHLRDEWIDGSALPNLEAPGDAVANPADQRRSVAFGPLGRGWPERMRYAGTYDDAWLADVFPFLPNDFDDRYFQAAPEDQQISVPQSPLQVTLSGLTQDGMRDFELPYFSAPVHIFPKRGGREDHFAQLDTIAFDTDEERFTMSWRVTRPLKKSMHEIAQVLVGRRGREWWQLREVAFPIPVVMIPAERTESSPAG